jgi:RNA polymerase sigma-70 factor (ECF subfamily)
MTLRSAKSNTMQRDEFERIYVEHRERLFAFLTYRTGNRALAEDLLGDVFERAFRARARFDPQRGSQTAWLYTIAVNRLRDHHRRAQVERASLERVMAAETVGVEAPQDAIADRDRVMQALAVLSQRDREIIALRFGADLTAPQIARVTGQPLTTVEGRLFRALRRLGTVLQLDEAMDTSDVVVALSSNRGASR